MSISSLYSNVVFDPALLRSSHAKYLLNFRLVALLIMLIVVIGLQSYTTLPRRLNPEIKIPIVTIVTALPGSGPQDVEQLITDPLEQGIKSLKNIDTYNSTSQEGVSVITIQFKTGKDPDKAKDEVQSAIDQVRLPENALKSTVRKLDFEDQPVWAFSVSTDSDYPSLQRFVSILKKRLDDSAYTDRVLISGDDKTQIVIHIKDEVVRDLGISIGSIREVVSAGLGTYPAGSVQTSGNIFSVTTLKKIQKVSDITQVGISIQGKPYTLGDIAEVSVRPLRDSQLSLVTRDGKRPTESVVLYVYKTASSNVDTSDAAFKKIVNSAVAESPRFQIQTIDNNAEQITKQFDELLGEFKSAIFLVFLVIAIFLGFRQALLSSLTFPLTFLSAFALMKLWGLSIDFLSLFGFLIALGLLIDDTIVTVTAMTRYHQTGKFTGQQVGLLVWRDFIVPLWSTTITTIWAFVPLLLSTGIIGEFIKPIPLVVTFNMVSSTAIAVLVTIPILMRIFDMHMPYRVKVLLRVLAILGILTTLVFFIPASRFKIITILVGSITFALLRFLSPEIHTRLSIICSHPRIAPIVVYLRGVIDSGFINLEILAVKYQQAIRHVITHQSVRRQVLAGIVLFAVVGFALVPAGLVKNEFFPRGDARTLYISGEMGAGTLQRIQVQTVSPLIQHISKIRGVEYVSATTNSTIDANGNISTVQGSFLITVRMYDKNERDQKSYEIADEIRQYTASRSEVKLSVVEQSGGPPAGADVVVKYTGDDLAILEKMADQTISYLKGKSYILSVDKSLPPAASRIVFHPNVQELAKAGVTEQTVGTALRSSLSGTILGKLKIGDEEKDITYSTSHSSLTPTDISTITIRGNEGAVPLSSLGVLKLEANPSQIKRENGKRIISVNASVKTGASVSDANADVLKYAKEKLSYPPGYALSSGGVNEENQKSVTSILQAMILAFMLILITMVIEFRSFRLALLTLLCVPLAVSAVMYVFALFGIPLSFPSLIGILALFGIVVTTAIVIVEKINENREHGMNIEDAIVDAAGSRLEPIILTSLTTIVGLIPISASDPVWRGLGGAIISGLLFSGLLKLFFIPIVYRAWMWEKSPEATS